VGLFVLCRGSCQGGDECWDGGFGSFDGGFVAEITEGTAGDWAYGCEDDVWGKGEVRGFEKRDEITRCRCAGEGDGVGVVLRLAEEGLERGDGVRGNLVAVGFGDGDDGSGGGQGFRDCVTGFGCANKEEGFAGGFGEEGFGERFCDVAWWDEIDGEADGIGSAHGGGADDGNMFGKLGDALKLSAAVEDFDGVRAGEEQPVVGAKAGESCVEAGVGFGWGDLDGGDEDGGRAESFELSGKLRGLVAGAGDEDAFVG